MEKLSQLVQRISTIANAERGKMHGKRAVCLSLFQKRGAGLVLLAEIPLPGCRKQIQTEFVIP